MLFGGGLTNAANALDRKPGGERNFGGHFEIDFWTDDRDKS
jgi:hypothetical protein